MRVFEIIRKRREQMHLTQRIMADTLGVDIPMYSRYERGVRPIREELLPMFSNILNIEYNYLRNLWLADKVYTVVNDETNANEILAIVSSNLAEKNA